MKTIELEKLKLICKPLGYYKKLIDVLYISQYFEPLYQFKKNMVY